MIMYDQDPDVLRWGLHLLQGDSSSSAYSEATIHSDANIYQAEYSRESSSVIDCTNVENDEIIAHALQEELSQVALAEARGTSPVGEEHLQASVLAQDWLGPVVRDLNSDKEGVLVENEGMAEAVSVVELSTLSCSQFENISEGQSWSLELTDDLSSLDGEVGKRLDKMVPVPHIPRINGEIPSVDEATSDHERLLERLKLYELVELKVQGDGNCQFRSLSDQFYRTTEHHKFVRQQVVDQLKSHPDIYEGYVPMAYEEYLRKMSKSGEWGDHVTLQAAADSGGLVVVRSCLVVHPPSEKKITASMAYVVEDAREEDRYGVKIFVLTSFKDTCYIEIMPIDQKSKRVIFLSFWAEVHYNSIYPEGELPAPETKRKKGWWHFGHKH